MDSRPRIIKLQEMGNPAEGYLSIVSVGSEIPFLIQRSFITHDTPPQVIRGRHAHYQTEMVLICIKRKVVVNLEEVNGIKSSYVLRDFNEGLYIPKLCWHSMQYEEGSIQLVLCSTLYNENDYIRDYKTFEDLKSNFLKH